MVSAIICPIGSIQYMPGRVVNTRTRKYSKRTLSSQNSVGSAVANKSLPFRSFSNNFTFYQREIYSNRRHGSLLHRISASVGSEVTLEEPNIDAPGQSGDLDKPSEGDKAYDSGSLSETESLAGEDPSSSGQTVPTRNISRNGNPRVPNEDLVPGATFTGIVRKVQSFGAFIDFGAPVDGLVHVSRLSDSFVRDPNDVVSVGQEVTVRIVEVNLEKGRISLTMSSKDRPRQVPTVKSSVTPVRSGKVAGQISNQKREATQKRSELKQGQIVNGKVKNMIDSGVFIKLNSGEEGFLRSDEAFENYSEKMDMQIGQKVTVTVLRIENGKVDLTMKNDEGEESFKILLHKGSGKVASNPFELFFRKDPVISSLLKEKEKLQENERLVESQAEAAAKILEEHEGEKVGIVGSGEEAALTEEVDNKISVEDIIQIPESIRKDKESETLETNEKTNYTENFSVLSTEQVISTEYPTDDLTDIQAKEVNAVKYISDHKKMCWQMIL